MHRGAEHHGKTARPWNQAQHDQIRTNTHPEPKDSRASDGKHKNGCLEGVVFLSAVAE
jgi:hypothetical protein